jgi:ubiquinone biosynthesis protein
MTLQTIIRSRFRFAGELGRAAEVATTLAKYGLAGWFTHVNWIPLHDALKSHDGEVLSNLPFEARVRLALTDLGTTFIKLGQMLSTRADLVGQPLADELSKLQRHLPPHPPEVALKMVEEELGRPIAECFASFEPNAFASASVGQVHEAKLKSGRRVVVKVQHPGIEGVIRRDLEILRFLAEIAEGNDTLSRFQPGELVREFSRSILNELDFRRELRNLQSFRRSFAKDETVLFPRPYPDLTTGRVLTMEMFRGASVTEHAKLDKLGIDRSELAKRGATVFIQMIFRDGFYHADPHPGNFIVLRNGKIGLIDAGMVGRLDEQSRSQIEDILIAAGDQDGERLTENVLRLTGRPDQLDRKALTTDLTDLFEDYGTQPMDQFNVGGLLQEVTNILHKHRLILPGRISMLIKCLVLLEGTGRLLSPTFSLASLLAPWRGEIIKRRFSVTARLKKLGRTLADWERLAESIPRVLMDALDRLEGGHLAIRLEHRNLKSAVNRLVGGIFISALLLSSALIIGRNVPPVAWGVSIPGALGYLVALFFGAHLLWMYRDKANKDRDEE